MKYQDSITAIMDGINKNVILKYQGIKRKKKQIIPAINLFDFFTPNSTGNVFIPFALSPRASLMSFILETVAKKTTIAMTRPKGKAKMVLSELTKKNPAIIIDRQAKLTKNEFKTTNLFRRSGGLE